MPANDFYSEKLVAKIPTWKTVLAKTGIVLAAAAVIVFAVMTLFTLRSAFGYFFAFVVVGAGYGAYYLVRILNTEYEYIIVNDSMDIDKITAKASRKTLLTVDLHTVEEYGEADERAFSRLKDMDFAKVQDFTSHVQAPGRWYLIYSDNGNRSMLFLEPNDKMLSGFRMFAPGAIRK